MFRGANSRAIGPLLLLKSEQFPPSCLAGKVWDAPRMKMGFLYRVPLLQANPKPSNMRACFRSCHSPLWLKVWVAVWWYLGNSLTWASSTPSLTMPHPAHMPPLALFPLGAWEWGNWVQWPPGSKIIFSGESYCLVQKSSCLHVKGAGLCFHNNPGTACPSGMDSLEPQSWAFPPSSALLSERVALENDCLFLNQLAKLLHLSWEQARDSESLLEWVVAKVVVPKILSERDPPKSASRKRNSHDHN